MKRADLDALQLERLRRMVDYCYNNVPFYNERLKAAGITSGDRIKTLSDIQYIPFTTKGRYPRPLPVRDAGAPDEDIVRIHASSGTTGKRPSARTRRTTSTTGRTMWRGCARRPA